MEIKTITLDIPDGANIIVGQTHFIKTAEDLYEAMINAVPGITFGIAFCEASGPRLIRVEGNDNTLKELAIRNASAIAAGHTFVILMKGAFPVNVLNAVKACPEVCSVFCATANPVQVTVAETEQGRGVGLLRGAHQFPVLAEHPHRALPARHRVDHHGLHDRLPGARARAPARDAAAHVGHDARAGRTAHAGAVRALSAGATARCGACRRTHAPGSRDCRTP